MIKVTESPAREPVFHLRAGDASYILTVFHGFLLHLYCGPAISDDDPEWLLVRVSHDSVVPHPADTPESWFSLDIAPQECPVPDLLCPMSKKPEYCFSFPCEARLTMVYVKQSAPNLNISLPTTMGERWHDIRLKPREQP